MTIFKRPGLIAFVLTTSVLIPAGIHLLEAGPAEVARLVRPGQSVVTVDGASVKVTADRGIVEAGGLVHVKLTATADKPRAVRVALIVEEARGSDGGRVSNPPEAIAEDTVELQAAPGGGAPRELAYKLRGYQGSNIAGVSPYGYYTVLVMPPAAAAKLEHLQNGASAGRDNGFQEKYSGLADSGEAARLEVLTKRNDPSLQLELPASVQVGQPFQVAVTMKNTGHKALKLDAITLSTPSIGADYLGLDGDAVVITGDGALKEPLAPKSERRVVFTVTVKTPGLLGLEAGISNDTTDEPFTSALDAIEVRPANVPVVAQAAAKE